MDTPGQIAYAAFHGRSLPVPHDEWPDGDRMVKKWEAVGAAVVAAARERCATVLDDAQCSAGENNDLRAYELLRGLAAAVRGLTHDRQSQRAMT